MAFVPTHVVPQGGLPAWMTPDGSQPPAATLAPGTALQLVEQQGGWARVAADNGWAGWVNAAQIVAYSGAPATAPVPGGPPPTGAVYAPPAAAVYAASRGEVGQPRPIGVGILLFIVTFGIYGIYWVYKTHDEIQRYSGRGAGGAVGLVIYFVAGVVTPFLIPTEIKTMYEMDGRESPVTGATGAWVIPGILILVGPFIWFAKVQGALNDFWVSKGAAPV